MIYIYYTHIIHVIKSSSYFKNKLLKYYYICTVHVYVSALCVAGVYLKISLHVLWRVCSGAGELKNSQI